ncbi:hypothetical protein [Chelonobacter oris]|uniref:hypothetical protein n=1 Tax=Chelonobacter oris TaxID=505317 RepID=UPI001269EA9A|nr:hypothetical protein [Chelonobacter oris]
MIDTIGDNALVNTALNCVPSCPWFFHVDDLSFGQEVEALQQGYLQQSDFMDIEKWINRPIYQRFFERLFFLFSPLL